jgi:hypothetical protein
MALSDLIRRPRAGAAPALLALLLLAISFALPAQAAPIPLSKPVDLRGKRVLIVPLLGREAGSYSMNRMIFFPSIERELGDAGMDIDTIAARETEARLDGLGVDAQVLRIAYDEIDIYGDKESSWSSQMPRRWKVQAIAQQLLKEHEPAAVLMLVRGALFMGEYNPPAIGYGVVLTRKFASAYSSMTQALYVPELKRPLAQRFGSGFLPLEGVVAEENLEFPPPETWAKARPLIEDMTGRIARSLAAEAFDRARRPPETATSTWRSQYPREEGVNRVPGG